MGMDEKTNLDGIGRCYVINRDGFKTAERFKQGSDYENVAVSNKSKFFFLNRSQKKKDVEGWFKTDLELIFIVDLRKAKPSINHRADMEVETDVEAILNQFDGVWITSIDSGYERALNGINYEQKNDMQPYHVFKFNLAVSFSINETCCC